MSKSLAHSKKRKQTLLDGDKGEREGRGQLKMSLLIGGKCFLDWVAFKGVTDSVGQRRRESDQWMYQPEQKPRAGKHYPALSGQSVG